MTARRVEEAGRGVTPSVKPSPRGVITTELAVELDELAPPLVAAGFRMGA